MEAEMLDIGGSDIQCQHFCGGARKGRVSRFSDNLRRLAVTELFQ